MPIAAVATGGAAQGLERKLSRTGGAVAGPPNPIDHPDPVIRYSTSADRSSPTVLDGATVDGVIYVHLLNSETEIDQVSFWLNPEVSDAQILIDIGAGNDPKTNGHIRNDSTVPYDLQGGAGDANPFNTATLADDTHTLKVGVRWIDGDVGLEEVTFTVFNDTSEPVFPQVPTGLNATAPSDYTASLNWNDTATSVGGFDDTDHYQYRYGTSDPPGGSWIDAATSDASVTPLAPGTWYFQVRGVDADGDVSAASASDSATVTGESASFDAVTSWTQFFPAGNGVDPQPNAILAGGFKGNPLEGQSNFTDDIQYPAGFAWSSPNKTGNFTAGMVSVSGSPSDAVERYASLLADNRIRDIAHPTNGGWGSETRSPEYGARKILNCTLTRRKHNAKYWVKQSGNWNKTNINNPKKETLGYTPGLPNGTTNAEDSAVSYAILISGGYDSGIINMANALVDDRSASLDYGEWVERMFFRGPWECTGPWSSDYTGISPNLIGSSVLEDVADGVYGLGLNQQAKDLLDALRSAGDPAYETFNPTDAFDSYPGWREIEVDASNPDAGTGGDMSILAGTAYRRFFEVLWNTIIDRCDFRGVEPLKPICGPNFAHPGAAPTSGDEGGEAGPESEGWAGSGGAPDGGDLYQPHELSRQLNIRYLDTIGSEYMAFIDMDFYLRNTLLGVPADRAEVRELLTNIVLRFLRPVGSSECGFTFSGNKDTATGNTVALAAGFRDFFHPVSGLWANLPTTHVGHYIPDGNNVGVGRYRVKKELDNVGADIDNPWYQMTQFFPGRGIDASAFYGVT